MGVFTGALQFLLGVIALALAVLLPPEILWSVAWNILLLVIERQVGCLLPVFVGI